MPDVPDSTLDGVEYAWGIATLFPAQGEWTEEEYLSLTDSRRGIEFVEGRLEFLPMATEVHQALIEILFYQLRDYVMSNQLGRARLAGLRVRTKERKIREPDIVFLHKDSFVKRSNRNWEGASLVMEVVSDDPKDRRRDYEEKRIEYAEAGIAEYWIVDYEERVVIVNKLVGDAYAEHGRFGPQGRAASALLDGFGVDVGAMFAEADEVPR